MRQLIDEHHVARNLVPGQIRFDVGLDLLRVAVAGRGWNDEGAQPVSEFSVVDADDRRLTDIGTVSQQVLDLQREDVLTTGNDHVVVATIDKPQASLVEMPHVTAGQQTLDDLLVCAVRVPAEAQSAGDENRSGEAWFGDLAPIRVIESDRATDWRPAHCAWSCAQFLRCGHGGDGHLGRTVEVVEHITEDRCGALAEVR